MDKRSNEQGMNADLHVNTACNRISLFSLLSSLEFKVSLTKLEYQTCFAFS